LAQDYANQAISLIGWYPECIGFLKGHTGIYSVAAAVEHALGNEEKALEYVEIVQDSFK